MEELSYDHVIQMAAKMRTAVQDERDPELVFLIALKFAVEMASDVQMKERDFMEACYVAFKLQETVKSATRGGVH
jgi:hypothetical protein